MAKKRLNDKRNNVSGKLYAKENLFLENFAENSFDSIFATDHDYRIIYANPAFERLKGFERNEAYGEIPLIFKSSREDPNIYGDFWKAIQSGRVWEQEFTGKRKNGGIYYSEIKIVPIEVGFGSKFFLGIEKDITKIREYEEKNSRYRTLPDFKPDPILQTDYDGNVILLGKKTHELFSEIAEISNIKELLGDEFDRVVLEISNKGSMKKIERHFSLENKHYQVNAVDIPNLNCINFYFSDITDLKKVEEKLIERKDELERFYKISIGRELKMIELKKRMKELEQKPKNIQ